MPHYLYVCESTPCERRDQLVELAHSIAACDDPQLCPGCGRPMQRRIAGMPMVYWPGRYFGERDGWFWDPGFPKMQSVRDGEHVHSMSQCANWPMSQNKGAA